MSLPLHSDTIEDEQAMCERPLNAQIVLRGLVRAACI